MEDLNNTTETAAKTNRFNSIITYVSALLSVIALIVAFSGKSDSDTIQQVQEQQTSLSEKVSKSDNKVEELKKRVDGQMNSVVDQVEKNLNKLSQTLAETNVQVASHGETLQQLSKGNRHHTPAVQSSTSSDKDNTVANANTPAQSGEESTHTIQSGDTFGKLAQRYSTSIVSIQNANPNIDPRRLKVGQQIKIPAH